MADTNVVALVKDEHRYTLMFQDSDTGEALKHLGRMASDPELNFTWYDAALLSQKIRKLKQDSEPSEQPSDQWFSRDGSTDTNLNS